MATDPSPGHGRLALARGTLEWGETLVQAARRSSRRRPGVSLESALDLCGVYSKPERDYRFHMPSPVLVSAQVSEPSLPPCNPLEIAEVPTVPERRPPPPLVALDERLCWPTRVQGRRVVEMSPTELRHWLWRPFEAIVDGGVRRGQLARRGRRGLVAARSYPGANVEMVERSPGVVLAAQHALRLPSGHV
jgi:ADP-ribose pyrophosphatase YjhB (NUDIX family)